MRKLWSTGLRISEKDVSITLKDGTIVVVRECDVRYCHTRKVAEFDCGQFCKRHWVHLPDCATDGCENPAVQGLHNPLGLCRICQFDYNPVAYHQGFGNSSLSIAGDSRLNVSGGKFKNVSNINSSGE